MNDNDEKIVTGEVVEAKPRQDSQRGVSPQRGGVFIGTLNIMTEPAKNLVTTPLRDVYKSRYEGKFKRPKHVFTFDLSLIAIGAALAVIAIYFGLIFKPFDPIHVQLISAPNKPVSGSEIVIKLNVANMSEATMQNAVADLKYPKEIEIVRSSLHFNRDTNRIAFGLIESQTDVTARLVGKLNGTIGQKINISTTVTYTDIKTGETKTRRASTSFKIMNSTIGAEFELPEQMIAGQIINGSIRYFNYSNDAVKNTVIIPEWPQGFAMSSTDSIFKNGRWEIGTLAPGSENKINFTGIIYSSADEVDFALSVNDTQSLKTVSLVNPQINVRMSGTDKARLGDTVNIVANIKNSGEHTISNPILKIIPSDGLTVASINDLITDEIKLSSDIEPGINDTINLKMKISNTLPDALKNSSDVQLGVRATITGKLDNAEEVTIASPSFGIKIASQLGLASLARYWSASGDQLGRGPIPPTVGQTTRYWVFLSIKNTIGAVNNVRVSAQLPTNVGYTGKASVPFGDAPEYDPATRTITWNIGKISAWPGVTGASVSAGFEVSLIPTPDQVGTYPILITNQKVSGTDTATGLSLSDSSLDLNSKLSSDPKAASFGPVK